MRIENPLAFSFIMQDDIYLLPNDKEAYHNLTVPEPVLETPVLNFNYMGKHKKKFLIVSFYPEHEFFADKHLTALENTLKRLDFSLEDTAILNMAKYESTTFAQLAEFFLPKKLLILGQNALPVGLEMLSINTLNNHNDCRILLTFSFEEMMDSNETKKAFWEQMKQL